MHLNRREFLRAARLVGGAAMLGGPGLVACDGGSARATNVPRLPLPPDSVLAHPATECPIDTVVIVMMENRSFDHYLGWLGGEEHYVEEGRRRYGRNFHVDARVDERYRNEFGIQVETRHTLQLGDDPSPYRGCNHRDPGHSWIKGRVQRDRGFLASGTGNDSFAASYYLSEDIPVNAHIARRFTVMDRHHASLLGPTFPNRQYLFSAQSEGLKTSLHPLDFGQYSSRTIFEKLESAGVQAAEYFTNLPISLLWGARMFPFVRTVDVYFSDAAAGTLPQVSFITPPVGGAFRPDDHPQGDIALGQRFIEALYARAATTGTTSASSDFESRRCLHRRTPDPGTSITISTTTRRSSASSSGDFSARPRRAPARKATDGSWPSATDTPTTTAPASG